MIIAEFVALVAVLITGGIGTSFVISLVRRLNHEGDRKVLRAEKMIDDLSLALRSHDYRQLDDWLVLYADADGPVRAYVKIRRDELYIECNP